MNKKTKIILGSAIGAGVLVAGAVATYATISIYKKDETHHNEVVETEESHELNVPVNYYDSSPNYHKVLDKVHVRKFIKNIEAFSFYGPEVLGLSEITINDDRIITPGESGIYYPLTGQLGVNTFDIERKINNIYKGGSVEIYNHDPDGESMYTPDAQEIIIESMAETFFHEYGHHIFTSYASNPFPLNHNYSNDMFLRTTSSKLVQNRINKDFLDSFIKIFKYDDTNKNTSESNILLASGSQIIPISKMYSLSDLFDNANHMKKDDLDVPPGGLGFIVDHRNHAIDTFPVVHEKDTLKYLYSAEELFTRKLLISSFSPTKTLMGMIDGSKLSIATSLGKFSHTQIPTSLVFDMLKYDSPHGLIELNTKTQSIYQNKNGDQHGYFRDNPFENRSNANAKAFMESVAMSRGEKQLYEISYISHQNNLIINDGYVEGHGHKEDLDMIKFGGYLPQNSNQYKSVGYKNASGKFVEISEITTNTKNTSNRNFGSTYKKGLLYDVNHETYVNKSKWWTTNKYTDVIPYADKELYLYNDEKDFKKLSSYRGESKSGTKTKEERLAGSATTFFEDDGYSYFKKGDIWGANKGKNNGVVISKMGQYNTIKY